MAVSNLSAALAIRSSFGIELWTASGAYTQYEHKDHLPREETKNLRSCAFSANGQFFAYSNGSVVKIFNVSDWSLTSELPRPKAFYLKFSPRGNFLCTWELYTVSKDKPEGSPNMFVYEVCTGNELFAIVQKKQTDWEPAWAADESLFAFVVGGEALFYDLAENGAGFKSAARKIGGLRGGMLSLGLGNVPPYLAFYAPGTQGGPSMCKLYKYPNLSQNEIIACKSFFQADRVEMLWNKRGNGLLLLTSTEVDKSGASYYGNQALHFMSNKGESCSVPLAKKGPVHCVKWNPKANEFLVVYGFMPSKASLYNLKCDVIFDFGEGPRNCAYFNPFGNIVVLAGFGNLPGNVEIWDVKKREIIANIKCPDTTYFDWNPNGEYFLTATTAPRLRISNGFKVYHYSGALMHETIWPKGKELLGVEWQTFPEGTFTEPVVTKKKQEGIKSSTPEASKKVYTPPHLRLMKEGKNPNAFMPQPSNQNAAAQFLQNNHNFKINSNNCSNAGRMESGNSTIDFSNGATKNKKNKGKKWKKDTTITNTSENYCQKQESKDNNTEQQPHVDQNAKWNPSEEYLLQAQNLQQLQYQAQSSQLNVQQDVSVLAGQLQVQDFARILALQSQAPLPQGFMYNAVDNFPELLQQYQPEVRSYAPEYSQGYKPVVQNSSAQYDQRHETVPQQPYYHANTQSMPDTSMSAKLSSENFKANGLNVQNLGTASLEQMIHPLMMCDPDKEEKIRNLTKKLFEIQNLKARQSQGETLQLNQLNKISKEAEFTAELKSLSLRA